MDFDDAGFGLKDRASLFASFLVSKDADTVNGLTILARATGLPILISARGSDTDIDVAIVPKGAGRLRVGAFVADPGLSVTGYIEIKDIGGTVRKLAVV